MKRHGILRSILATAALVVLLAVTAANARDGEYERIYPVERDTRLVVEHTIGTLVVIGWDRDEIAVEADYDADAQEFEVRDRMRRFSVELTGRRGPSGYGDIELRVPRWIPIEVTGHQVDVEIEGVESSIDVDLVGGDVFVVGGRDEVSIRTVHGGIEIHDAVAELDLNSVHEDIELRDCIGDVRIETVNGDVRMEGIETADLDIQTTHGDVLIDGALDSAGDFFISTHAGDVEVSVSPDADMTIHVDAYRGALQSTLDVDVQEIRRDKSFRITLGEGTGRLDIESFEGDVRLYDPKVGRRKRG